MSIRMRFETSGSFEDMSSESRLGRSWDSFDAYLFDIDGTLIECTDATHYFAFCEVLKTISGREMTLDGVVAHGNTDIGILRDALTSAGVPGGAWRHRLPEMRDAMTAFVYHRKDELRTTILPRVRDVLEHLRSRGATLGVATGNLERIGRLKLEHAGLLHYFDFGGWSDEHEYRVDVFRAACAKARQLRGIEAALCVLGDTPSDILAAHDNELPVIAVSTGVYSFEQLSREAPELCLHSLAELFVSS